MFSLDAIIASSHGSAATTPRASVASVFCGDARASTPQASQRYQALGADRHESPTDRLARTGTTSWDLKRVEKSTKDTNRRRVQRRTSPPHAAGARPSFDKRHASAAPSACLRTQSAKQLTALQEASVVHVEDLSPSVATMGVGTLRDQKLLATKNAELRRELRLLRGQSQRHVVEHEHLRSNIDEDSIGVMDHDREALEQAIALAKATQEALKQDVAALTSSRALLIRDVAAERLARNSVQKVLFERSDAFHQWKCIVAAERQRQEETKMHDLLQRQLAAASAGERMMRPPTEVRAERNNLREIVVRLTSELQALQSKLAEIDEGTHEARQRANELLVEDDELEERLSRCKEYIASAKKMMSIQD